MADDARTPPRWGIGAGNVRRRIEARWQTDVALSALLAFVFCLLMVAPPLIADELLPSWVFDVLFSLVVVSGVVAVSDKTWVAIGSVTLAAATLLIRWLHFGLGRKALEIVDGALGAVTLFLFACMVLVQVLRKGRITMHRVRGSVAAFLLFGLSWAAAYELVFVVRPGAFRLTEGKDPRLELLYYSFVTLTTVGYGDITPLIPFARSLAIAEALLGQLFPAVLIARLVSLEIAGRRDGEGEGFRG
jgi:voltage-gated potassium channel Kch